MEVLSSFVMTLGHCIESSDTTDSHCVAYAYGAPVRTVSCPQDTSRFCVVYSSSSLTAASTRILPAARRRCTPLLAAGRPCRALLTRG